MKRKIQYTPIKKLSDLSRLKPFKSIVMVNGLPMLRVPFDGEMDTKHNKFLYRRSSTEIYRYLGRMDEFELDGKGGIKYIGCFPPFIYRKEQERNCRIRFERNDERLREAGL